jgi:hypothetical protein
MELLNYKFRGARSLVLLHEFHLPSFYNTWKQAKEEGIKLPETDNPDYESMQTLLVHVLGWAGNYMRWICKNLNLSDPEISTVPSKEEVEEKAEDYIKHLLERWRIPLADLEWEKFELVFEDRTILAMMEHAVMHPIRHEFQLKELMSAGKQ